MLARYQIVRGKRPPGDTLPDGIRHDVRAHRHHFLSPEAERVEALLANPTDTAFEQFHRDYEALLAKRFAKDRAAFDELAASARDADVFIGCSCPTKKNPDVMRCHTAIALRFMKKNYPRLVVKLPK
jgi:hypothetical protein